MSQQRARAVKHHTRKVLKEKSETTRGWGREGGALLDLRVCKGELGHTTTTQEGVTEERREGRMEEERREG